MQFSTGYFKGLRARGRLEVDARWKDGRAVMAELHALANGTHKIVPPKGHAIDLVECDGKPVDTTRHKDGSITATVEKGKTYRIGFKPAK